MAVEAEADEEVDDDEEAVDLRFEADGLVTDLVVTAAVADSESAAGGSGSGADEDGGSASAESGATCERADESEEASAAAAAEDDEDDNIGATFSACSTEGCVDVTALSGRAGSSKTASDGSGTASFAASTGA